MSSNVASFYDNGGMIGATLNLGSTEQYITGSTTGTPSIVGTASASGASSVSLTGITGLAEGDLVVVFASEDNSTAPAVITSTGWTILVNGLFSNSIEHSIAYKVMGATVDTSISIQSTIDAITVIAMRNVQYTDISSIVLSGSAFGTLINPASITVTDNDSVVLVLSAIDDDSSTVSSPPSGYTTAVQDGRAGGSNAIMYKTGVSAGTEDPAQMSWSTGDSIIAYTLVFSPTSTVTYGNYKNSGIWSMDAVYDLYKPLSAGTVIFLTSGTTWTVPAGVSSIQVECIGSGGGTTGGGGGGGGAYAKTNSLSVTAGGTVYINVGGGVAQGAGVDSWLNVSTNAAPSTTSDGCLAKGGSANVGGTGGSGGSSASCVGNVTYSGGNGGDYIAPSRGGGGGAAGPNGAGAAGGVGITGYDAGAGGGGADGGTAGSSPSSTSLGGDGGDSNAGTGGTGGSGTTAATDGTDGGGGGGSGGGVGSTAGSGGSGTTTWTQTSNSATAGPGGGGGGSSTNANDGGAGGGYGGGRGGGGNSVATTTGGPGIIVITTL